MSDDRVVSHAMARGASGPPGSTDETPILCGIGPSLTEPVRALLRLLYHTLILPRLLNAR